MGKRFASDHKLKNPVTGINMDITEELPYMAVIIAFEKTITIRQDKSFKHNIKKDCKRVGSRQK